jgi:hypothetical protein
MKPTIDSVAARHRVTGRSLAHRSLAAAALLLFISPLASFAKSDGFEVSLQM